MNRTPDPLARFPLVFLLVALTCVGPIACQSLYTGTVTLTQVVESAAREYAALFNDGLVPPDIAPKAALAHQEWRKAAGLAADALEAYKAGKGTDTKAALEAARLAASHFIDVLVPLLTKQRTAQLRAQVQKAEAP